MADFREHIIWTKKWKQILRPKIEKGFKMCVNRDFHFLSKSGCVRMGVPVITKTKTKIRIESKTKKRMQEDGCDCH